MGGRILHTTLTDALVMFCLEALRKRYSDESAKDSRETRSSADETKAEQKANSHAKFNYRKP